MRIHSALSIGLFIVVCHLCATPFWLRLYLLSYQEWFIKVLPPSSDQGIPVTFAPTPLPEWNMNDNVRRLVNHTHTLSKLWSGEEEDYKEEWAGIGCMVSADAFEFGLHAGSTTQEGSHD